MAPAVEYLIDVYPEYVPIDGLPLDTLQEKVSQFVNLSLSSKLVTNSSYFIVSCTICINMKLLYEHFGSLSQKRS